MNFDRIYEKYRKGLLDPGKATEAEFKEIFGNWEAVGKLHPAPGNSVSLSSFVSMVRMKKRNGNTYIHPYNY